MATMEELADQVAHATTGKEVRGAIAEGFGQFDQVKGEVFWRVMAVEDDNATLNAKVDKLSDDLAAEAQVRAESEGRLSKRIAVLEQIIFGQNPQEVKMADNSTPPLVNGGAMLINLTSKEDK